MVVKYRHPTAEAFRFNGDSEALARFLNIVIEPSLLSELVARLDLRFGDYIIRTGDGFWHRYSEAEFRRTFEEVTT